MKNIIARILAWLQGDLMQKVLKCLPQIVALVEKAMADGQITPEERKQIAMDTVDIVAAQFNIKISALMRWVISVIVDNIAKNLPQKTVAVSAAVAQAVKEG